MNQDIPVALLIWGFLGQALFTMRFVVQWYATEKAKKSVMPTAFWYFSLAGSFTLLSYAIMRNDPPIILGQLFGFVVYIRNLYYIHFGNKQIKVKESDIDILDDIYIVDSSNSKKRCLSGEHYEQSGRRRKTVSPRHRTYRTKNIIGNF